MIGPKLNMMYVPKLALFQNYKMAKNKSMIGCHCMQDWGIKVEYKGKFNMEVPNGVEPFFNVEEGLKIIPTSVYNMLKNRLLMGQK